MRIFVPATATPCKVYDSSGSNPANRELASAEMQRVCSQHLKDGIGVECTFD